MMLYIKKVSQLVVFIFLFFSCFAFAKSTSAAAQLGGLLHGFQTYQAKFNQVTLDSKGAVIQRSYGRVMIRRPGGFRWEADTPTKQIIIVDKKTLWTYDVDLQQATKRSLDTKASINPALLLSGSASNLTNQFNVTLVSGEAHTFLLKPKHGSDVSFKSVQLRFKGGRLVGMRVVNSLGETSVFSFTHIQLNARLAPRLFQFKPPPSVDVVNQ